MGINFDYSNYIGSYRYQQIPKAEDSSLKASLQSPESGNAQDNAAVNKPAESVQSAPEYNRAPKTANLEDISLTFNKQDDFGTIGQDADIAQLDIAKAVSDSKRSSILAGYRTFMGPTPEQMVAEFEDGLVIPK